MFTVTLTINHKVNQFTGNLYTESISEVSLKVLAYSEQGKKERRNKGRRNIPLSMRVLGAP